MADVALLPSGGLALPFPDEKQGVAAKATDDLVRHVDIGMAASDSENNGAIGQYVRNRRFISEHGPHPASLSPVSQPALSGRDIPESIRVGAFGVLNAFNGFTANGSVA